MVAVGGGRRGPRRILAADGTIRIPSARSRILRTHRRIRHRGLIDLSYLLRRAAPVRVRRVAASTAAIRFRPGTVNS